MCIQLSFQSNPRRETKKVYRIPSTQVHWCSLFTFPCSRTVLSRTGPHPHRTLCLARLLRRERFACLVLYCIRLAPGGHKPRNDIRLGWRLGDQTGINKQVPCVFQVSRKKIRKVNVGRWRKRQSGSKGIQSKEKAFKGKERKGISNLNTSIRASSGSERHANNMQTKKRFHPPSSSSSSFPVVHRRTWFLRSV